MGAVLPLALAGLNAATGIFGAISAGRAKRKAEAQEARNRVEMNRLKNVYSNLDTSNPFLNMENTMEDLTVNQKQANFQAQQFQQSQANVLDTLRDSAGGSGVAALAQSLAQQGQIATQKASGTIGQQEARNQQMSAREASRIQFKERDGELKSRQMERDQVGTMLGMSQQETAAAMQQAQMAQQAKFQAISSGISGVTSSITAGMEGGFFDQPDTPEIPNPNK